MKKQLVLGLVGAAAVALPFGIGVASPGFRGAHNCLDSGPTPQSGVYRGTGGLGTALLHFDTVTSKVFTCPVEIEQSSMNPTTAKVIFSDGSTVDDVVCAPYVHDDGVTTGLGTKFSCATAGGCLTANLAWTGNGSLDFADAIGAITGDFAASFSCNLGVSDAAFGTAQITSYELSH